jgi:hypothetical protein
VEDDVKYVCLGYMDEKAWDAIPQTERDAILMDCAAYNDALEDRGLLIGMETLQSVQNATTLRWRKDRVAISDGPFAETREQLGGLLVIEARDLNHAIQLMSHHPGLRLGGSFEVRPATGNPRDRREGEPNSLDRQPKESTDEIR